jgi:predicted amidohydrolase YtcJ
MLGAQHIGQAAEARNLAESAGMKLASVKFMPGTSSNPDSLADRLTAAIGEGLDCAFHATEIDELECALAAMESAQRRHPSRAATRWRIEHGGLIPPDYIPRLQSLRAWVVTNPGFVHFRGVKYRQEPGLVPYLYRVRSLKLAGIELAGATDAPVTPARPLAAIAAACSRMPTDGGQLAPDETIDVEDAFALFTSSAARLARVESGEIGIGKLADLIVLPHNPLEMTPADLMSLPIDMTIIDGQIAYERGVPALSSGMPDL